jgi:hypothetical protein
MVKAGHRLSFELPPFFTWTMQEQLGVKLLTVSREDAHRLQNDERVLNMPIFPQSGYIEEIDGIIVIKISEGVIQPLRLR